MTTIIAKHGKTYDLKPSDVIQFGTPLKTTEGGWNAKKQKFAYRWKTAAVCYLVGVEGLELVDGTTYRAVAAVEVPAPEPTPVPPPTPEPTTPPPPAGTPLDAKAVNGEVALQTPDMTVVLNASGAIGQMNNAPIPGFRSDTANNFLRIGMFVPPLSDLVLQGRAIEGFGLMIAGKRYANMPLTGYNQIKGGHNGPTMWQGGVSGVDVTQNVTMAGKTIRFATTLRNTTGAAVDVQYFRSIDPDQAGVYNTANKVVAAGIAESAFKGGKLVVRAPGADFHVTSYDKAPDIGTRRDVGVSKTADEVVQPVFPRVSLAAGQSATYIVEYEVVL